MTKRKLCHFCKREGIRRESVIYMKEHRLALCEDHFIQWFEKRVEETIKEFKMFKKNEKVLIAVSGGKDSMTLWYVLNKLGYDADGFFLHLGIGHYSDKSMETVIELGKRIGKKPIIIHLEKEVGTGMPVIVKMLNGAACSICGRFKRYYFNKVAIEGNYKAVATGHNLDDEASSLLANLINWNLKYLASKRPVLPEEHGFPRKVKPLAKLTEEQIRLYAQLNNIPIVQGSCPLGTTAKLHFYKEVMQQIENHARGTKLRFYLDFLRKVQPLFIEHKEEYFGSEMKKCKVCGQPSPTDICLVCRTKQRVETEDLSKYIKPLKVH